MEADRTPQIMVVDDDPDTVSILARHLQREGFVAIEAISGADCVRIAQESPVIMITARDDLDARAEGMRLGVSDFLAKPVFRRQLANRIRAQLDMLAAGRATEAALSQFEDKSENNSDGEKK